MIASFVESLKIDVNALLKTHTYSQLYLLSKGMAKLYKTDDKKGKDFKDYTGDEYMRHLQKEGL